MGSIVLLDLMGGVALLMWGLHMVRSGIMRAFGSELRRVLGTALRNRFLALLAGIGVTALLQSSTATGLLMTSFAARGLVDLSRRWHPSCFWRAYWHLTSVAAGRSAT
jgi:phosphate:Na+ symporter